MDIMRRPYHPWLAAACAVLAACTLPACDRTALVRGVVQDFQGQALPGVTVTAMGRGAQALTNGRGEYSMRVSPGPLTLDLVKTGYTPGRVETGTLGHGWNDAPVATLWPLPPDRGVYLLAGYRYRAFDRAEPKPFATREFGVVRGTSAEITLETRDTAPHIVCHDMPPFDLRLHRVVEVMAADPEMDPPEYSRPVWAPETARPIVVSAIDELTRQLIAIEPAAPLDPGCYAVHWGAFDGYTSTDPRVFLFRILPEEGEAEGEDAAEGAGVGEDPA